MIVGAARRASRRESEEFRLKLLVNCSFCSCDTQQSNATCRLHSEHDMFYFRIILSMLAIQLKADEIIIAGGVFDPCEVLTSSSTRRTQ